MIVLNANPKISLVEQDVDAEMGAAAAVSWDKKLGRSGERRVASKDHDLVAFAIDGQFIPMVGDPRNYKNIGIDGFEGMASTLLKKVLPPGIAAALSSKGGLCLLRLADTLTDDSVKEALKKSYSAKHSIIDMLMACFNMFLRQEREKGVQVPAIDAAVPAVTAVNVNAVNAVNAVPAVPAVPAANQYVKKSLKEDL